MEFYGVVFGRVEDSSWWNKVSVGQTGRKTQNTTLKAKYLDPILRSGMLFSHPDKDEFLNRMEKNREARRLAVQRAGPELEAEDQAQEDGSPDLAESE